MTALLPTIPGNVSLPREFTMPKKPKADAIEGFGRRRQILQLLDTFIEHDQLKRRTQSRQIA